jgi:hypothetical protein
MNEFGEMDCPQNPVSNIEGDCGGNGGQETTEYISPVDQAMALALIAPQPFENEESVYSHIPRPEDCGLNQFAQATSIRTQGTLFSGHQTFESTLYYLQSPTPSSNLCFHVPPISGNAMYVTRFVVDLPINQLEGAKVSVQFQITQSDPNLAFIQSLLNFLRDPTASPPASTGPLVRDLDVVPDSMDIPPGEASAAPPAYSSVWRVTAPVGLGTVIGNSANGPQVASETRFLSGGSSDSPSGLVFGSSGTKAGGCGAASLDRASSSSAAPAILLLLLVAASWPLLRRRKTR